MEMAEYNITVNAYAPGIVGTVSKFLLEGFWFTLRSLRPC